MSPGGPKDRERKGQTSLLLVRHGETPWNAARRWQGHADPGLTDAGLEQAKALARRLAARAKQPWSRLFSSDLARARETAAEIGLALGLTPAFDPRLRELDVGDWSGRTRAEIEVRDRERLLAFEGGDLALRPGGGESRLALAERARAFAAEVATGFPGEALIVVTHLGVIRALAPGFEPTNAEVIEVFAEAVSRGEPAAVAASADRAQPKGDAASRRRDPSSEGAL